MVQKKIKNLIVYKLYPIVSKFRLIRNKGPLDWCYIPKKLKNRYSLDGTIHVKKQFRNGLKDLELQVPQGFEIKRINKRYVWTENAVRRLVEKAIRRDDFGPPCYPNCANDMYRVFEKYPVKDMNVLVVGSISPWIEAIAIAFGAKSVTTTDYNIPISKTPLIKTKRFQDLMKNHQRFDALISFSSLEHSGLGRYGDKLDPDGDLKAMKEYRGFLKKEGLFYLSVPVGEDVLFFNAHRIYGEIRFPLLISGWKYIGESSKPLFKGESWQNQPVFVLQIKE